MRLAIVAAVALVAFLIYFGLSQSGPHVEQSSPQVEEAPTDATRSVACDDQSDNHSLPQDEPDSTTSLLIRLRLPDGVPRPDAETVEEWWAELSTVPVPDYIVTGIDKPTYYEFGSNLELAIPAIDARWLHFLFLRVPPFQSIALNGFRMSAQHEILELQLQSGISIIGRARYADGKPVRGALVEARCRECRPSSCSAIAESAVTDDAGNFRLLGAHEGFDELVLSTGDQQMSLPRRELIANGAILTARMILEIQ